MNEFHKKKKLTIWICILVIVIIGGIIGAVYVWHIVFAPFDLKQTHYVYIDESKDYEKLIRDLKKNAGLPSEKIFRLLADKMKYQENIKTGRYAIVAGMTMPEVIRTLRAGKQVPLKLTFNNIRLKKDLASHISRQLMLDSTTLMTKLNDEHTVRNLGFNMHTITVMFVPNTYEVYWDTPIDKFLARMRREYNAFWNDKRKAQAGVIGLSPVEVSVLASIVEEEASYEDEYAIIAGLYLNRLRLGRKLEADPTVKFAVGDFGLRRILYKHLDIQSPYNTYLHVGLPPGPIRVPSIKAIDATLDPARHNYIFMCAKEDLSGRHNFATTLREHNKNAARYRAALNAKGIY